jgi:L-aminopeptidase/D-esterase-like protein
VESDDVGWEGRSGGIGIGARRLRGREAEGATVTANAMAPDGRRRRLSLHSALPQTSSDGGPEGVQEGVGRSDKCPVW